MSVLGLSLTMVFVGFQMKAIVGSALPMLPTTQCAHTPSPLSHTQ